MFDLNFNIGLPMLPGVTDFKQLTNNGVNIPFTNRRLSLETFLSKNMALGASAALWFVSDYNFDASLTIGPLNIVVTLVKPYNLQPTPPVGEAFQQ